MQVLQSNVWSASFNGMLRKLNETECSFLGCCYNRLMINIVTSGWIPCEWNCNVFVFFFVWPSPIQTLCHTHISSIYLVVTFYFRFMNENISRAQALEHNVTIMNLFSVLLEKSFSLAHTVRRLHLGAVILNASESLQIMTFDDAMCIMIRALMCARMCVHVCMRCL